MSRLLFWPLIVVASSCLALGSACFAVAAFSDPTIELPRRVIDYDSSATLHYFGGVEVFGRAASVTWADDRGFLVAAMLFLVASLVTYVAAVRSR
jgi:hypothetical protein